MHRCFHCSNLTEEGEGKNEMERGGILIENRRENRRSIRSGQDPAELVTRKSNRNCREKERKRESLTVAADSK